MTDGLAGPAAGMAGLREEEVDRLQRQQQDMEQFTFDLRAAMEVCESKHDALFWPKLLEKP